MRCHRYRNRRIRFAHRAIVAARMTSYLDPAVKSGFEDER